MSISHEISNNKSADNKSRYLNKLSQALNSLWMSNKLCDVHLYVEGVRYVAHKLLIIANCKSIRAKVLATRAHDIFQLHLKMATKQGIAQTLSYLYTSEVYIHVFNFADVLITSHELGVEDLLRKCELFVDEYVKSVDETSDQHRSNLPSFGRSLVLLQKIREKAVYKNIMKYVALNFDYFMETDEFLDLNVDILYSFLACYDIVVKNELELLYGILKWLNWCPKQRRCYKKALLVRINFQYIEPDKLIQCGLPDRIMKIPEIQKKVAESVFNHKNTATAKNSKESKKSSLKASVEDKKDSLGSQKSKNSYPGDDSDRADESKHENAEHQSDDETKEEAVKTITSETGESKDQTEAEFIAESDDDEIEPRSFKQKIKKIATKIKNSFTNIYKRDRSSVNSESDEHTKS